MDKSESLQKSSDIEYYVGLSYRHFKVEIWRPKHAAVWETFFTISNIIEIIISLCDVQCSQRSTTEL